MLGPAVHTDLLARLGIDLEAELGGDYDLVADRRQSLPDNLLIGEGTIDLGGVEEGHAAFRRIPDQLDGILFAERMAIAGVEAHTAEADGRNLQVALSKLALLHCCAYVRVVHLLFRDKLCAGRGELLSLILCDFRIFEVEQLNRLDNRRRDDEAGEPLVVGGHHEPGRILRRRRADRLLAGVYVIVPVAATYRRAD